MFKSLIDMSKPHAIYACGIGLIMLLSLLTSNVKFLAFSNYANFANRRELCAGLFIGGALLGAFSLSRHIARTAEPWRVPQSQVSWTYSLFFIITITAVSIAR
jgi:hypothetical protein